MKSTGVGTGGLGGVPSYNFPAKRRWKGLVIGVLGLVILSMLVPLGFLLGLHNGFHSSGYISERQNTPSHQNELQGYDSDRYNVKDSQTHSEEEQSTHVEELIRKFEPTLSKEEQSTHVEELIKKFEPTLSKDGLKNDMQANKSGTTSKDNDAQAKKSGTPSKDNDTQASKIETTSHNTKNNYQQTVFPGVKALPDGVHQSPSTSNNSRSTSIDKVTHHRRSFSEEDDKPCELAFGSYCLWRQEHREDMKDVMIKKLKDQLFVARAYFPTIAKLPAQDKLSREMKQNIQDLEHVLSESTTDADLPLQIEKKLQNMEVVIAKAKSFPVDCSNVDKKLRQIYDLTEDEADFHMMQSAFLYKLNVQTMPKSLHCLSLKLTVEYFKSPPHATEAMEEKFKDSSLHHYVIFSNNVLAASVVINSTVVNAKESWNQVFHVLTDGQNYYAMKLWFLSNSYREAAVEVLNIEQLALEGDSKAASVYLSLPEEFRISLQNVDSPSRDQIRTEYISIFSVSHYLLPDIFSNLKKVVVLDDDVVIQQDLSALWSLALGGKVNGAMQLCTVRLGQLKSYLGDKGFAQNSCAWMSGLNIIDLVRWKELGLTQTYKKLIKELSTQEGSKESATWRASLLTFEDKIYPLDDSWVLSGLGHHYGVDAHAIKRAKVLHYNGNMKPWLDLGISEYKSYWRKFVSKDDQFLSECNIHS